MGWRFLMSEAPLYYLDLEGGQLRAPGSADSSPPASLSKAHELSMLQSTPALKRQRIYFECTFRGWSESTLGAS